MSTRYEKPEYEGDSRPETQKHIDMVNEFGQQFTKKLTSRLLLHDASKLIEPECKFFDEGTPNLATSSYGEESYEKAKDSIREGIEHHYKMNDHHPEHFGSAGVSGMNLYQLIEMYLDWRASSLRHADGNIFKSIKVNKDRFKLDPQVYNILMNTAIVDAPELFVDAPDEVKEELKGKI